MATQTVLLSQPFGNRSVVLFTLARQRAIKAIKRELQARGVRLSYIPIRDIRAVADAHFAEHRAELTEEAHGDCSISSSGPDCGVVRHPQSDPSP